MRSAKLGMQQTRTPSGNHTWHWKIHCKCRISSENPVDMEDFPAMSSRKMMWLSAAPIRFRRGWLTMASKSLGASSWGTCRSAAQRCCSTSSPWRTSSWTTWFGTATASAGVNAVRTITRSPDHHRYDARGSEDNKNSRSFRSRKTVWSRQCLNFGSLKSVKIHELIGSMSGTRRIWGRNSASLEDLCGPLIHHGVPVDESSCQWECWSAGLPVKRCEEWKNRFQKMFRDWHGGCFERKRLFLFFLKLKWWIL